MSALYLIVLVLSLTIPLFYTLFKTDIIRSWIPFSISTLSTALLFLIWDLFFTRAGVWGFNEDYCIGLNVLEIPVEEILFFLVIPFCSLFIHFAFLHVFPQRAVGKGATRIITIALILISLALAIAHMDKAYTSINFAFLAILLTLGLLLKPKVLSQFYISFLIILIPFSIVNGVLTGAITEAPIVWYDNNENLGIRLGTIPVEDIGYAFSMLIMNLMIFDQIVSKKAHSSSE